MSAMCIDVVNLDMGDTGVVNSIVVTDGNKQMSVTPYQIFSAMTQGLMVSNTARVSAKGIEVLAGGEILEIVLPLNATEKKLAKLCSGVSITEKPKTPAQKESELKRNELELERQQFLIKQEAQLQKNRELAARAREQGLVNLSPEERRKRRQEYFRNKKNNG